MHVTATIISLRKNWGFDRSSPTTVNILELTQMPEHQKVVLVGPAHPLRGGLATYNERLIREYRSRGDDAFIYTCSLQYPGFLFPGKTQYSTEPAPRDIPIEICVNSINPLNWIRIGYKLRKQKPDLVIVKFWMPFMAPCLGTITRIIRGNGHSKIISIIDNIIPHEKRPGDRILAQYWVNSCDGFIAMSKSVLDDLKTFSRSKPMLFSPHPLYDTFGEAISKDNAKRRLNLDKDSGYVLFFGFIRDYKGLDLLLQAFTDKKLRKRNLKLLVAGEFYTDPKPYQTFIENNNLGDVVILSNNFIPDSEVVNYFCSVDLVVQPYKSATQSGVTQIAYHFGKPMIVTDVGGLSELVPDGVVGYVVQPEPSEIASAIDRFYEENKEMEFSENASREKQKYSWGKMVEAIDRLKTMIK
jgi:D-inositol-3-phosphate glycosyltransferase